MAGIFQSTKNMCLNQNHNKYFKEKTDFRLFVSSLVT